MSNDSPLFDRIRVKPDQDRRQRAELPACEWPRCDAPATHRAPKGRLHAAEYWRFCLDHVREYNNSYNFFEGMSDDAIAKYQKEDLTGHRPTWKMGSIGGERGDAKRPPRGRRGSGWAADDPFGLFDRAARGGQAKPSREVQKRAERLLGLLPAEPSALSGDALRAFRALEVLERIGTPAARQVLQMLAHGTCETVLRREADSALERLARRAVGNP